MAKDIKNTSLTQVEKFILKDESLKGYLYSQMSIARNLKSQSIYLYNKVLREENKWLSYFDLRSLVMSLETLPDENGKTTPNYYRLDKKQVSGNTAKEVHSSFKSYARSIKDWSKNKSKYKGQPRLPRCPKKKDLYSVLTYTNQCSQLKKDAKGNLKIVLLKGTKNRKEISIKLPKNVQERFEQKSFNNGFQQVRIIPLNKSDKNTEIEVEIVYKVDFNKLTSSSLKEFRSTNIKPNKDKVMSIDIGEVNFATIYGTELNEPLIINGLILRHLNKSTERLIAHKKSVLPFRTTKSNKKYQVSSSRTINKLHRKRARRNRDFAYKVAALTIITAIKTGTGTIVVGYNKGIKNLPSTSKEVNQTLSLVPWKTFIDRLKYLSELIGINLIVHEEAYTSKCDALALEEIKKHEVYLGKRTNRDTFVSSTGVTFNADVNGALNILRKGLGTKGDTLISSMLKKKNFVGSLCRPREVHIYESRYAVHLNDGLNSQNMEVN